jgi:hypothetical protein
MKTSIFLKTSPERLFSFQTLLRDIVIAGFGRDQIWAAHFQ